LFLIRNFHTAFAPTFFSHKVSYIIQDRQTFRHFSPQRDCETASSALPSWRFGVAFAAVRQRRFGGMASVSARAIALFYHFSLVFLG